MKDAETMVIAKSPLDDFHHRHDGRMVPFAGWSLPVQYPAGIKAEHLACRAAAGLFDISHMGQLSLYAKAGLAGLGQQLEQLLPFDSSKLLPGRNRYSLILAEDGGILDDLMISCVDDHYYLVVNAARTSHDIAWLQSNLPQDISLVHHSTRAMLALQGPAAGAVLERVIPQTAEMMFMDHRRFDWQGQLLWISRSGYTGEDGFEISCPAELAETLADTLLGEPETSLCGLGARDSLRLEAGLPLWGHDIEATTTPAAADLGFAIAARRRNEGGFPGAATVQAEIATPPALRRVGLVPTTRQPVREGARLHRLESLAGDSCGHITSGGFGPTTQAPVAMGYLEAGLAVPGATVFAEVRGRPVPMTVTKLPFVPHRYRRG